jgi:glycosyltransferase involved in cell wall biosynthesis
VLQVIPRIDEGGAERGTIDIVAALSKAGARALVVTAGGRLMPAVDRSGGRVVLLPVDRKSPLVIIANGRRLASLIKRESVDIIHARSRAPAWSALVAARLTGIPFVTTYHGIYHASGRLKRWYNSVMARGDRVIANSAHTAEEIRRAYPAAISRMIVIPRGVDLSAFDRDALSQSRVAQLRRTWHVADEARLVLLAGRLSRWKGQDLFIDAAALLGKERPLADVVFVLAGAAESTRYLTELMTLAERAGLGDRLVFAGHCNDMPAAYATANVVVSASREPEPFGRVMIEAQAMGAIVVATDHGGAQETVRTGAESTGFRVAPGDARALAQGIAMALSLPEEERRAMASRARGHVHERFSTARMCADTLEVYRMLATRAADAARGPR